MGDAALDIPQEVDFEQRIRPDPNNCNVYYYLKVPLTCGEGNAFNKASLRCDTIENVARFDPSCGEGGGLSSSRGGGSQTRGGGGGFSNGGFSRGGGQSSSGGRNQGSFGAGSPSSSRRGSQSSDRGQ